jgi:hypothetical protein
MKHIEFPDRARAPACTNLPPEQPAARLFRESQANESIDIVGIDSNGRCAAAAACSDSANTASVEPLASAA